MKIGRETTVFDGETGEILKRTLTFGSQNGDGWVIWYRDAMANLAINAPVSSFKVMALLASKQEFEGGINTTKQAIADELSISYRSAISAFNWLKEHKYIKERKLNGQTQFLLNPNVTTCGKNRKDKLDLWESIE